MLSREKKHEYISSLFVTVDCYLAPRMVGRKITICRGLQSYIRVYQYLTNDNHKTSKDQITGLDLIFPINIYASIFDQEVLACFI